MVILSTDDMFEVHLSSLIADYDKVTVTNLYQPIIGYAAMSVYFTLISEAHNQKHTSISNHEHLFLQMGISSGEFIQARKALEGVGLLKTYLTNENGVKFYRYEIYAPKAPNSFLDDVLLYGILVKYIGKEEAQRYKQIYQKDSSLSGGENISASFKEVYNPNLDEESYMEVLQNNKKDLKGRNSAKINTQFSYEKFFKFVRNNSKLDENCFKSKELKEIERIATLYGANEEETALTIIGFYNEMNDLGNRVDFESVNNILREKAGYYMLGKKASAGSSSHVTSDSDLAQKINIMDKYSPKKYLSILQNGTKPASSDLLILDSLSKNFGLANPVINVVVDYVLAKNNNRLIRAYAEKVAASLARERIDNALDAMTYLIKGNKRTKLNGNKKYDLKGDALRTSKTQHTLSKKELDEVNELLDELGVNVEDGKA